MRSPSCKSSSLTGFASVGLAATATLLLGVIANKLYAVILGPTGVGVIAVTLSLFTMGAVVASCGLGTSVAQLISVSLGHRDPIATTTIRRTGRVLALLLCMAVVAGIVAFRESVATLAFATPLASGAVVVIAPAIAFTALAYMETGVLTGHQRLGAIAATNLAAAGVGAIVGIPAVAMLGTDGIAPALLVTAVAHFAFARRQVARLNSPASPVGRMEAGVATRLLRLGGAAAVGQLATVGVQLAIPVLVLHALGEHEAGLYRASAAISIAYLTLFVSTLTYEFLPRISRVSVTELRAAVDLHMRVLLGIAMPIILATLAAAPVVLHLLFSSEFSGAATVLQWQLVGDLLRLPAWTLTYALVSQARSGIVLAVEVVFGVAVVTLVPLGLRLGGLEGVGIGYAAAQCVYLLAAWIAADRLGITSPGRLQLVVVGTATLVVAAIAVPLSPLVRGSLIGALAIALAGIAWPRLYRLHQSGSIS